ASHWFRCALNETLRIDAPSNTSAASESLEDQSLPFQNCHADRTCACANGTRPSLHGQEKPLLTQPNAYTSLSSSTAALPKPGSSWQKRAIGWPGQMSSDARSG